MENRLVELKIEDLEMISGGDWGADTLTIAEKNRLQCYAEYTLIYYNANIEEKFWEYFDKYHAYYAELEEKYGPSGWDWDYESYFTKFTR